MTPPNGEAVKQGKQPKPSEKQETIVKEITLRNKIKNKILDDHLDTIVPNGKVAEQGSEKGEEQITHPIPSINKGIAKVNPNERSHEEALGEK